MTARKCGEGVGRAWICLSGVEDGGVLLDGGGGCANFVLKAWGLCHRHWLDTGDLGIAGLEMIGFLPAC